MSAPEVRVDLDGAVAEVVLCAPERRNALTAAMAVELLAALEEVAARPEIAGVIIRGEGGYFCAGADRASIESATVDPAVAGAFDAFDAIYETFVRLGELPVPTIAAVRGGAVGAGLNLALAADVRVVADDARLLSGFVRIGLHPGGGHFRLLERLVGPERAVAMSVFGVEVDGAEAVRWGLAFEAVPDASVEDRARELADRLRDPELIRQATNSWRAFTESNGAAPRLLVRAEQAAQMWSMRRRSGG